MTVGAGDGSLPRSVRRGGHSTLVLLTTSLLACVEPGLRLDLPEGEARVALFFGRSTQGRLRSLSLPLVDPDGLPPALRAPSLALRSDESLRVITLGQRALLEAHPLVDMGRLDELEVVPAPSECALRRNLDGWVEAPISEAARVFGSDGGPLLELDASESAELRAAVGRLMLPLGGANCPTQLRAARFGESWSVFADVFTRGDKISRRLAPGEDGPFKIENAEHLDEDRIVLVTNEGIAVVRRGEQIHTWDSPFYFRLQDVPGVPEQEWFFDSIGVHPREPRPGVRRVVANARPNLGIVSASRLVIFDVTPERIEHAHTSTIPGRARNLAADDQRLLGVVGGEGTPETELGLYLAVLGDGDRFEEHRLEQPYRHIAYTGRSDVPYVGLLFAGGVMAGDIFRPGGMRGVGAPIQDARSRRSLAVIRGAPTLQMVVGNFGGELLSFSLDGGPGGVLQTAYDARARSADCVGPAPACGDGGVAGEARYLWAAQGAAGPALAVGGTQCARVLVGDLESACLGLSDPADDPIPVTKQSRIFSMRGDLGGRRALVAGERGIAYELIFAEP